MSMAFIRKTYGVPAKRGARVEVRRATLSGDFKRGTIKSSAGTYIRILLDGDSHTGVYHPTWQIRYLSTGDVSNGN